MPGEVRSRYLHCVVMFTVFLQYQNVVGLGVSKITNSRMQINNEGKDTIKVNEESLNRRRVIKKLFSSLVGVSTVAVTNSGGALAVEGDDGLPVIGNIKKSAPKKPFAPAPALLPAARVKYTIEESIRLVGLFQQLGSGIDGSSEAKHDIIIRLQRLIGVKSFMSPLFAENDSKSKAIPIDESIMKPSKSKVYQETYNEKLKDISPIDVPAVLFSKVGDYRQFDQLQRRQRKLEKLSSIREALNYYTRQLQFDTEYYVLNASAEVKKQMIRNDALPDIKSVIVADLDLRDLVRNQVLDAFDDVKYELEYQLKSYEKGDGIDDKELMAVFLRAKKECDEWFSFISDEDVKTAMLTVANE